MPIHNESVCECMCYDDKRKIDDHMKITKLQLNGLVLLYKGHGAQTDLKQFKFHPLFLCLLYKLCN